MFVYVRLNLIFLDPSKFRVLGEYSLALIPLFNNAPYVGNDVPKPENILNLYQFTALI